MCAAAHLRGCRSRNPPIPSAPGEAKSLPQAVRPGRHHPLNPCRTGSLPLSASRDQLKGDVEQIRFQATLALCTSLSDRSIDDVGARVNTRFALRPMFRPSPLVLPHGLCPVLRLMFHPTAHVQSFASCSAPRPEIALLNDLWECARPWQDCGESSGGGSRPMQPRCRASPIVTFCGALGLSSATAGFGGPVPCGQGFSGGLCRPT